MSYRHIQKGYVTVIGLGCSALLILAGVLGGEVPQPWGWLLFGLVLICMILFATLTVGIQDGVLYWYFGPGFWKKRVLLADIVDHHRVQNPWFYGWGIRYFGHGWLYNVSGPHAVEILLANDKTIRIGTDEPRKLDRAIAQALPGVRRG